MPPNNQTPAPNVPAQPVATERDSGRPGGGERVIQPLHDPLAQQRREEMARRMNELLGDEEFERTQINTNTAKHPHTQRNAQTTPRANAASASTSPAVPVAAVPPVMATPPVASAPTQGQIPAQPIMPQPPLAAQQQIPNGVLAQNPSGQAIYQQMMQRQAQANNATQNVIAQMQAPIPATQQQAAAQPSIDPRAAALKLQELQAQEMPQITIPTAPMISPTPPTTQVTPTIPTAAAMPTAPTAMTAPATGQVASVATPATPTAPAAPATTPNPPRPRTSLRINPEIVKKAADASILMRQKTTPTGSPPITKEAPVQAIQPAYIQNLETELAADMQTAQNGNSLSNRMAAELANDQITLEANKLKAAQPAKPANQTQTAVDNTPKTVLDAMQNAMPSPNLESNPNFKHE